MITSPTGARAARELAEQTWDSVHGDGGELDQAKAIIRRGLDELEYTRKYRPWASDEIQVLEGAVRGLRAAAYQRELTADEFYLQAHDEAAATI